MAQRNQKKQILLICGSAAAVCALAIGGVYYADGQIDEIQQQIEQKRQEISAAEAKILKVPGLEKDVVVLRENLGEYVKILPDNKNLNDFLRSLNDFEKQSGSRGLRLSQKGNPKAIGRFSMIEYSTQMTGTLWEILRFMNLIESYERFVNISEFAIATGGRGAQEATRDGDEIHTLTLAMQTYSYNGKASGAEVAIPDYDNLKASLREEIFRRMQKIHIEKYQHKGQQGRRDIFVDPRLSADQAGPDQLSPAAQRQILDKYIGEATKLAEMLVRVKKQETTMFEQFALEKALREGIAALQEQATADATKITYAPYRTKWSKEVVRRIEDISGEFTVAVEGNKPKDPYLPANEIEALVAQMKDDCSNGFLEEARKRYDAVAPQLAVPAGDPREALAIDAKSWHTRAVTALAFSGMDLKIQGVVVDKSGGRSGVLLNGETYEEGEYVSDELLVKRVEDEQVWFVFRGLTLVRTM